MMTSSMTTYRYYGALSAILAVGTIYGSQMDVVPFLLQKFPEPAVQAVVFGILFVFAYAYIFYGHAAARDISADLFALDSVEDGHPLSGESASIMCLREAEELYQKGKAHGQVSFDRLYDLVQERYERIAYERISQIDAIRVGLFFVGLLFTLIGVVHGFASQAFPTNAEESKLFSFTIIKALGLAYLPAATCLGTTLVLYILSNILQKHAGLATERFNNNLYQVVFLGKQVPSALGTSTSLTLEMANATNS